MSEDRARIFVEAHIVDKLSKPAAFAKSMGRAMIPSDKVNAFIQWKRPEVQALIETYRMQILDGKHDNDTIDANATVEGDERKPLVRWTRGQLLDRLQEIGDNRNIDPRICIAAIALFAKYTALEIPEKQAEKTSLDYQADSNWLAGQPNYDPATKMTR